MHRNPSTPRLAQRLRLVLAEMVQHVRADGAVERRVAERQAGQIGRLDRHAVGKSGRRQIAADEVAAAAVDIVGVEAIDGDDPTAAQDAPTEPTPDPGKG